MSEKIIVAHNSPVYFGRVAELLPRLIEDRVCHAVTDNEVLRHHPHLFSSMPYSLIEQGEEHKTLKSVNDLYGNFIDGSIDRHSLIIGIGGGIVTDVAGFAAATYMRGVNFGAIPTTLLAQVDASVGGKTGVNINGYKNMAGVFAQPTFVICDVELLNTLPDREFRAGMAEVIKAAVIGDEELFGMLECNDITTLRSNSALMEQIICRAVKVKAEIVTRDEREAGERRLLNLGHTFAHAIESTGKRLNHGEAVAIGIGIATRIAESIGYIATCDAQRIVELLKRYGLSIELPSPIQDILDVIYHDKKRDNNTLWLILPHSIGECRQVKYDFEQIAQLIEKAEL